VAASRRRGICWRKVGFGHTCDPFVTYSASLHGSLNGGCCQVSPSEDCRPAAISGSILLWRTRAFARLHASRYRTPMLRRRLEAAGASSSSLQVVTCWRRLGRISLYRHGHGVGRTLPAGAVSSSDPGIRFLGFMVETPVSTIRRRLLRPSASSRVSVGVGVVSSAGTGLKPRMRGRCDHGRGLPGGSFNLGFSFG
jgi:hypothetical protein